MESVWGKQVIEQNGPKIIINKKGPTSNGITTTPKTHQYIDKCLFLWMFQSLLSHG